MLKRNGKELFEKDNNYKVYCTRLSNTLPSGISKVYDRRTFANDLKADISSGINLDYNVSVGEIFNITDNNGNSLNPYKVVKTADKTRWFFIL